MKQLILGSFLAAIVLFVWGFIFWGALPSPGFHELSDEAAVWESLGATVTESGAYYIPNFEGGPESIERHLAGPTAFLFVRVEGSEIMPISMMLYGFLHMLVTAFLIGLLLRTQLNRLGRFGSRVGFVAVVGIVASFWFDFAWPIWWRTPWTFFLGMFVYDVVAWTLAGAVLARFVKPEPAPSVVAAS